ncbi:MAG: histidinol-phosphate transaminase, partial [Niveispirillum sp.]|nr:histidinol-phosphate transaminase [Niveispirillum sp.]
GHQGGDLAAALRAKAILVRHFNKARISDFLRISIGTDGETDKLLTALGEILG